MMRGSAATWVARRLPFADDAHREEVAASVAVAATTAWLGAFVTVDAVTSSTRATTSLVVSAAVLVGGQVSWTALRRNFTV